MRYLVVAYINTLQKGATVSVRSLYSTIYARFPSECESLGFTPSNPVEEKWKKDIRWGIQDAKNQGLIVHAGLPKSGLWKRI